MKIVFQIRPVLKSHLFYSKIIALIRFNTRNNYPVWRDHAVSTWPGCTRFTNLYRDVRERKARPRRV